MIAGDNRVTLRANGKNCSSASPHSSSEIRGMFAALQRLGYDLDFLLGAAGLSRADIEDLDTPIRSDACAMVLAKAQQQCLVKNLALRLALEMPIGSNPLLDYIIASSESVGDGLQRLARYLRLVNPAISIDLRNRQEPIQVIVNSADAFSDELCVSLSVLRMRSETRDGLKAEFVSFRHEPDDAAEYASMLGSPV
jgi:Arabinose-binding domain of AraC transcription regulator, N-term